MASFTVRSQGVAWAGDGQGGPYIRCCGYSTGNTERFVGAGEGMVGGEFVSLLLLRREAGHVVGRRSRSGLRLSTHAVCETQA